MDIKILDTGYISNAGTALATQTQLGDTDRAGYTGSDVSAMTLKVSSINLGGDVSLEDKPIINNLTENSTSLIGIKNRKIMINGIKQKSIDSSSWDKNDVIQLSRIERTRGLKIIYPTNTTDTKKSLIEAFGAENTNGLFGVSSPAEDDGTVGTAVPYLVGRVRNFTMTDSPTGDKWGISFTFELSG